MGRWRTLGSSSLRAVSDDLRRRRFTAAVALFVVFPVAFAERSGAGEAAGPRPVLGEARAMVSAPVGNHFHAHLWQSPSTAGGICSFLTVDHAQWPTRPQTWNGGGDCGAAAHRPVVTLPNRAHPLQVGLSIGRKFKRGNRTRWVPPIVHGSIVRELHVRRVQIEWRGGSHRLSYRSGHFLGGTPSLYMPPFAAFPFYVGAYDRSGREVARRKLDSPALRLMPGGWRQYAREYRAWKRRHR